MVLAPSQVEENWDLRRPLVVFIILCAVNPPLIPEIPPLSRRVNLESRLAGWGPAAGRGGRAGAVLIGWRRPAGENFRECSYSCVPLVRIRRPGDLWLPLRATRRLAQSGGLAGWVVGCGLGERKAVQDQSFKASPVSHWGFSPSIPTHPPPPPSPCKNTTILSFQELSVSQGFSSGCLELSTHSVDGPVLGF